MYDNLKYLSPLINEQIEADNIAGARISVLHGDRKIYSESFGMADKEKGVSMSESTLFRLFSLTKPITAAAAMILFERGKFELRYPLKWFLPTFENPVVLDEKGERPAERDITIRDLLTMTSGIPYPGGGEYAMGKMGQLWGEQSYKYETEGVSLYNTKEFALEMGKRPLCFSPGEKWDYGSSADIMGAVIEVISGKKLSDFMKEEIFEPLRMNDTGFYIPEEKYDRLAQVYNHTDKGNVPFEEYSLCLTDYRKPPLFESGGAGLVSTMEDYEKFAQMLMNGGSLGSTRILGRKTVDMMRQNFLNDAQMSSLNWDSLIGHGYGTFMRVLTDRTAAGFNASEGEYGWDGWLGCYLSVDPAEKLAMLYFIQQTNSGCTDHVRKMQNIIRAAI